MMARCRLSLKEENKRFEQEQLLIYKYQNHFDTKVLMAIRTHLLDIEPEKTYDYGIKDGVTEVCVYIANYARCNYSLSISDASKDNEHFIYAYFKKKPLDSELMNDLVIRFRYFLSYEGDVSDYIAGFRHGTQMVITFLLDASKLKISPHQFIVDGTSEVLV